MNGALQVNLSSNELYDFIVGDFEVAWDAVASTPATDAKTGHRGNFMFARQAMTLLEFAARLCASDTSGQALQALADEIERIEPRYFTLLPGICETPDPKEFTLPFSPNKGPQDRQLLWILFDLIRNGQAHQYQQINVSLTDGKAFVITLTGAQYGLTLGACSRSKQHLAFHSAAEGVKLHVMPHLLFLDFREAMRAANLMGRGLTIKYLQRPRRPKHYQFAAKELDTAFRTGGHWPL